MITDKITQKQSEYLPMNLDELFDHITRQVAHPHKTITEHDIRRAILIFISFSEYVLDHWQDSGDQNNAWVDMKDLNFCDYATKKLDELEKK